LSVWETTPGLLDEAKRRIIANGKYERVARDLSEQFKVEVTGNALRKKLRRDFVRDGVDRGEVTNETIEAFARKTRDIPGRGGIPTGRAFDDPRNFERFNPLRVGVLDIEATGLNAMFGRVLCACLLVNDEKEVRVYRGDAYPTWNGKRSDDSGVVGDLLKDLEDIDVIIAHNGVGYDLPMLRTRALAYRMPCVHPKKIIDPVLKARKELRLPSNKLDTVAEHLGVKVSKSKIDARFWVEAGMDGSREAMDYIVDHCIKDVHVLEEVAYHLRPYIRQLDNIGSWR
jgi:uncharacterized protein YprB with RNaseH-like and TPR domain